MHTYVQCRYIIHIYMQWHTVGCAGCANTVILLLSLILRNFFVMVVFPILKLAQFCSCAVPLAATVRRISSTVCRYLPRVTWRNFFVLRTKFYFFSTFCNIFKLLQAVLMNQGKYLKNIYAELFMYARPLNHILCSHKLCHRR